MHEAPFPRHGAQLRYDPPSRTAISWPKPHGAPVPWRCRRHGSDIMQLCQPVEGSANSSVRSPTVPEVVADVGVAGLWPSPRTRSTYLIVCCRHCGGIDARLSASSAGLVSCMISTADVRRYGVAQNGATALAAPALANCAPGVAALDVDNGYGAACAALRPYCAPWRHRGPWNTWWKGLLFRIEFLIRRLCARLFPNSWRNKCLDSVWFLSNSKL